MYNKALDTFKAAADCGSFTKAADKLFISHTAVIKQINGLEERFGTALFERTHRGIALTAAGECLYKELPKLLRHSNTLIRKVREAEAAAPKIIHVGTSVFYPCNAFIELWGEISAQCPRYRLQLVPITDDQRRLEFLGQSYDVLIGPYDAGMDFMYQFIPVGGYRFCITLPQSHPLSQRERLSLADLAGGELMVMRPGRSAVNDQIRQDLREKHPSVSIIDIEPNYSLDTFNLCMESGVPLLSLECWQDVHPGLCTVPLTEKYTLPYGVIAAHDPTENTAAFLTLLEKPLTRNAQKA